MDDAATTPETLAAALRYLPAAKSVSFPACPWSETEKDALRAEFPDIAFVWPVEFFGTIYQSDTAELSFEAMYEMRGGIPVYQPLPKFPAVTRDIAVVCDEAVTVGALEESIRRGAKGLLKDVSLFDIYRGPGVAIGKKSVAFSLVLRADDRSLTGEEADEDVQSILAALKADHNAVLR